MGIGIITDTKCWQQEVKEGSLVRQTGADAFRSWHSIGRNGRPMPWTDDSIARGNRYETMIECDLIATVSMSPDQVNTTGPIGDISQSFASLGAIHKSAIIQCGSEINHAYWPGGRAEEAMAMWYAPLAEWAMANERMTAAPSFSSVSGKTAIDGLYARVNQWLTPTRFDALSAHVYGDTADGCIADLKVHLVHASRRGMGLVVSEFGITVANADSADVVGWQQEMTKLMRWLKQYADVSTFYCGETRMSTDRVRLPALWISPVPTSSQSWENEPIVPSRYFEAFCGAIKSANTPVVPPVPVPVPAPQPTPPVADFVAVQAYNELVDALKFGKPIHVTSTIKVPSGSVLNLQTNVLIHAMEYSATPKPMFELSHTNNVEIRGGIIGVDIGPHSFQRFATIDNCTNSIFTDIDIRRCGEGFVVKNSTRTFISLCKIGTENVRSLRRYGVLISGGISTTVMMCTIQNSTNEHCIRAIDGHVGTNIIKNNCSNVGKGAITIQKGSHVRVIKNLAVGPITIGPLPDGDATPGETVTEVKAINNIADVNIAIGTDEVYLVDNHGRLSISTGHVSFQRPPASNVVVFGHAGTIDVKKITPGLYVDGRLINVSGVVKPAT